MGPREFPEPPSAGSSLVRLSLILLCSWLTGRHLKRVHPHHHPPTEHKIGDALSHAPTAPADDTIAVDAESVRAAGTPNQDAGAVADRSLPSQPLEGDPAAVAKDSVAPAVDEQATRQETVHDSFPDPPRSKPNSKNPSLVSGDFGLSHATHPHGAQRDMLVTKQEQKFGSLHDVKPQPKVAIDDPSEGINGKKPGSLRAVEPLSLPPPTPDVVSSPEMVRSARGADQPPEPVIVTSRRPKTARDDGSKSARGGEEGTLLLMLFYPTHPSQQEPQWHKWARQTGASSSYLCVRGRSVLF
jgi:hypothetical protein